MDRATAYAIVEAINDRCFFTMGLTQKLRPLTGVSLAEMLTAVAIVKANNAAPGEPGKGKTIYVIPDDRLIAAAYCADHYQVSNEAIVVQPCNRSEAFWSEAPMKALALVPFTPSTEEQEE